MPLMGLKLTLQSQLFLIQLGLWSNCCMFPGLTWDFLAYTSKSATSIQLRFMIYFVVFKFKLTLQSQLLSKLYLIIFPVGLRFEVSLFLCMEDPSSILCRNSSIRPWDLFITLQVVLFNVWLGTRLQFNICLVYLLMAYLVISSIPTYYYGQVLLLDVKLWLLVVPLDIQLDFAYGLIFVKSYEFKIRLSTNHTNVLISFLWLMAYVWVLLFNVRLSSFSLWL